MSGLCVGVHVRVGVRVSGHRVHQVLARFPNLSLSDLTLPLPIAIFF